MTWSPDIPVLSPLSQSAVGLRMAMTTLSGTNPLRNTEMLLLFDPMRESSFRHLLIHARQSGNAGRE